MKINYSCVVDKQEKFLKQGWLWLNSLIALGKINPSNIWINCIEGTDNGYINKVSSTGANVSVIKPYGDKKYCNKIAQMFNDGLKNSDAIVLMDTDMIMLENFEDTLDYNFISAKIVDMPNPRVEIIDALFELAGLKKTLPNVSVDCAEDITYGANFNGGLYIIPQKYYSAVQSGWVKWSQWLLGNGTPLYEARKESHIDQISFCMAVQENNIPIKYLSRLYNYPLPYQLDEPGTLPYILHYHTQTDGTHALALDYPPQGNIEKAVQKADRFISSK